MSSEEPPPAVTQLQAEMKELKKMMADLTLLVQTQNQLQTTPSKSLGNMPSASQAVIEDEEVVYMPAQAPQVSSDSVETRALWEKLDKCRCCGAPARRRHRTRGRAVAHRHLHEEIPNHSSKSDAYVSVSDEHKAEAILFLVEGRPKALSQRSDPKRRIHPYKESIERGKYTEVEAKTE
ncbi:hypothetical protein NE237_030886 [Protea cynaroides]|uniref:Uncharacterized protein n=1 Tax=Protea cynaroides TaxID=273540 RepID=A0A9Q0GYR2_9MAGN|nr:hypothetical protein NE237_030886 [Protea cynaroides]